MLRIWWGSAVAQKSLLKGYQGWANFFHITFNDTDSIADFKIEWAMPNIPGPSTKWPPGNGEKLTYSPAVGCNWLCLAGVYFPLFFRGAFRWRTRYGSFCQLVVQFTLCLPINQVSQERHRPRPPAASDGPGGGGQAGEPLQEALGRAHGAQAHVLLRCARSVVRKQINVTTTVVH